MAVSHVFRSLRAAIWQALQNNVLDTAKATAYSGMLMLCPAFLVLTTLLALVPAGNTMLDELRVASEHFLPADTMSLLQSYFQTQRAFSLQVILSATSLSLLAAMGAMLTLMEGFRRAYRLPLDGWGYWQMRLRAVLLVPIALVPLSVATFLLVFGHTLEQMMIQWMAESSNHGMSIALLTLGRLGRWSLALVTSAAVLGAVYHFGTHSKESWTAVAPGAITATLLWFPVTLLFGLYVTSVADYSVVYGSLGTAIATLVWLYITSFSVLLGAQFNGVLHRERKVHQERAIAPETQPSTQASTAPAGQEVP
jgi:membrane protein